MRTFVALEAGHLSVHLLEKHGQDVDDLLDMIRAAYRHDPWPRGG